MRASLATPISESCLVQTNANPSNNEYNIDMRLTALTYVLRMLVELTG